MLNPEDVEKEVNFIVSRFTFSDIPSSDAPDVINPNKIQIQYGLALLMAGLVADDTISPYNYAQMQAQLYAETDPEICLGAARMFETITKPLQEGEDEAEEGTFKFENQ